VRSFRKQFITYVSQPETVARLALATVYVWFGALKLFGVSPASEMIEALMESMGMGGLLWVGFMGIFETVLGVMFLFPKMIRWAFWLMVTHLGMTILPLFVMGDLVWNGFLVPTFEGQYILKNVLIFALGYWLFIKKE